jgi:hypothetical protein
LSTETSAAIRQFSKNSEHAGARVIDDLDNAAAIDGAFAVIGLFDPEQRAVADAGRGAGLWSARNMNPDFRRGAVLFLIPFGGRRDQLAVVVASGDVGHHGRRQGGRLLDLLAAFFDRALIGQFAQNALQLDAVGVFQAELARDLAGSDVPRTRTNKGDDGVPAWKDVVALLCHSIRFLSAGFAGALLGDRFCRFRGRGLGS